MNRVSNRLSSILFFLACVTALQAQKASPGWIVYTNARFQFALCYPSHLLKKQSPPENGDGQEFKNADLVDLTAFGRYEDVSLADLEMYRAGELEGKSGKITYRFRGESFFVLSGLDGDSVFYSKTYLYNGIVKSFQLRYPLQRRSVYDPIAVGMGKCFTDLQRTPHVPAP